MKSCDDLMKRGLRFIGVVKTATRGFCMEFCSEIEFHRGVCGRDTLLLITRRSWKILPLFGLTETGGISFLTPHS